MNYDTTQTFGPFVYDHKAVVGKGGYTPPNFFLILALIDYDIIL